jgi:hypothetical protein
MRLRKNWVVSQFEYGAGAAAMTLVINIENGSSCKRVGTPDFLDAPCQLKDLPLFKRLN